MTKAEFRQAQANKPCGPEGLLAIRKIAAEHQYDKVNETAVDAFTASAIIRVHDALVPENQAKLLAFPVWKVADICFKLINKQRAA